MKCKDFVKLFIPPIFSLLKTKIEGRRGRKVEIISTIGEIARSGDVVIVIGNGPSLNESLEKCKDEILMHDKMVVNFFGATDLFELLKPNIYVLADPAFFNLPENLKNSIIDLFEKIVKRTTWPMNVIIPSSAKGASSVDILRKNSNITIYYYYNGRQNVGKLSKFEAWDKNLIAPPAQTVLNTCLYLSLFWNYNETYLIGADMSFLEDVRIDQKTNELFVIDKHFYQPDKVYSSRNWLSADKGSKMTGWTLHDLVWAYGNMFKMYSDLKEYADYKGLKVYNASEYSWINVFERKKLK